MPRDAMAWVGDEVGNVMASLILPRYQLHDLMHAVMGTPSCRLPVCLDTD